MPENSREKIGSAKASKIGALDIYYVGGSAFDFVMPAVNGGKSKTIRVSKDKLDEFIAKGAVHLNSKRRYDEICSAIRPDGTTATHNADGTLKSKEKQIFDELANEGYVGIDKSGRPFAVKKQERNNQNNKTYNKDTPQREMQSQPNQRMEDPFGFGENNDVDINNAPFNSNENNKGHRTSRSAAYKNRQKQQEAQSVAAGDNPFDGLEPVENIHSNASQPYQTDRNTPLVSGYGNFDNRMTGSGNQPASRRDPRDLNGDGVVDEFDDLVEESKAKSPILILATTVVIVITLVLFIGIYVLIHGALNNGISLGFLPGSNGQEQTQEEQAQQGEDQQENQPAITDRTDFDPEDAVSQQPMASTDQENIAIGLFQAIRTAINSGDVNTFTSMIALDQIADHLSESYASNAMSVQQLQQSQADELKSYWRDTFIQSQKQYVVDKDLYGSIFGGRIREVRADTVDVNKLYVVMESIAGDHQRICFVVAGDGNSWVVTDVMDTDGYIKMISEGAQS